MAERLIRVGGLFLLSAMSWCVSAEELSDPTRPPAAVAGPVAGGTPEESQPSGLQSIIISKTRRAAIIDGETVELGGKHGDARLIEVNEGSVVLKSANGRQVLTLFPDVKLSRKKQARTLPLEKEVQPATLKNKPGARKEEK